MNIKTYNQDQITIALFLRSLLFNITFYAWTILMTILAALGHVFGHKYTIYIACLWGSGTHFLLKYIVGLSYEIRGLETLPARPCIFASKHQSLLETTMIQNLAYDSCIILKKELLLIPIFGQALSALSVIPIDRGKGKRAIDQLIDGAISAFEKGRNFMIYPEGTRVPVGAKTTLKHGIVSLYMRANKPVVPIALNTGHFWARRSFFRYPGLVVYQYLDPIMPGLSEEEFMKKLSENLENATKKLDSETVASKSALTKKSSSSKFILFMTAFIAAAGVLGYYVFTKADNAVDSAVISIKNDLQKRGLQISHEKIEKSFKGLAYELRLSKPSVNVMGISGLSLEIDGDLFVSKNIFDFTDNINFRSNDSISLFYGDSQTPVATFDAINASVSSQKSVLRFKTLETLSVKAADFSLSYDKLVNTVTVSSSNMRIADFPIPVDMIKASFIMPEQMPPSWDTTSLSQWSDNGGVVDVKDISILINPLRLNMSGSFSMDGSHKPLASLTMLASGVDGGIERLEKAKIMPKWISNILRIVLLGKGRSTGEYINDKDYDYKFSLTLQNDQVYIDGLPIFSL